MRQPRWTLESVAKRCPGLVLGDGHGQLIDVTYYAPQDDPGGGTQAARATLRLRADGGRCMLMA
jgi:hypothetical protein